MAKSISGRAREQAVLEAVLESDRAEMVALYGRRRVGKTFLVRELLQPRAGVFLEVTGTKDGSAAVQRRRFREALEPVFAGGAPLPDFRTWDDGLAYLSTLVERHVAAMPEHTIVLFFDELPWLATPRSGLLEAIDYYWNRHLSRIPQVKLILCGSAASWMLRRIVHARGGLHNRITRRMRLEPFSLAEAREYLRTRRIDLKPLELLELYMALGGVPYYLSFVERGCSIAETIGALCFERSGVLQGEFDNVFASLFSDHEDHIAILRALARRKEGLTRNEVIDATEIGSGGGLNRRLQELEEAGFIARVEPYAKKTKTTVYRIVDEHTLFYLKWIERAPRSILARGGTAHWRGTTQTPGYRAWAGYAFESICLKHARELQIALDIEHVIAAMGSWRHVGTRGRSGRRGAQVDLLFDRRDGIINLCEMKFSAEPFVVTKAYAAELREKVALFERHVRTNKRVVVVLIAPLGMKANIWSEELVDRVLDVNALLSESAPAS